MRWFKLTLAYDGTNYAGWQIQPGQPTVQQTLEDKLRQITGESVRTVASGRTDAGVHARGQIVSFASATRLSPDVLRKALNAELPADIAARWVEEAPTDFHAVRDAIRKRYRYFLHDGRVREVFRRRYVWQLHKRLDEAAMQRAAQGLVGEYDFSSFESRGAERASSVRHVSDLSVARCVEHSDEILIDIESNGFLYNMVRAIVGTLVEVGRGARAESWPREVLLAQDRNQAGPTAPPQGLFLMSVDYGAGQGGGAEQSREAPC